MLSRGVRKATPLFQRGRIGTVDLVKETQIDGSFLGWQSDVTYALQDGTRWKLAPLVYLYKPRDDWHPKAKLWRDGPKFYLEVATIDDAAEVVPAD